MNSDTAADIRAHVELMTQRSKQVRCVHTELRRQLAAGSVTLRGLCAQALFNPAAGSLLIRRALSAMPHSSKQKAEDVMDLAHIAHSHRLVWLANHPEALEALEAAIVEIDRPARPRQLPNPHWPWRGTLESQ